MVVLVTGATGLLGRRVVGELLKRHYSVRCLVHSPGSERVFPGNTVDVHYGNVSDTNVLGTACQGVEAIIHLVAVIRESRNASFDQINRQGVANLVAAAKEAGGVKRLVHISAIGVGDDRSYPYLYSKWQGEREVINSGIPYTIIRPSVLFGEGDEFLTMLAGLVRVCPLVPVVGLGRNRFQPIAAEDVAHCATLTLTRDDLKGKTLEIGGPHQLSYKEIVGTVARTLGKRRLPLYIPPFIMRLNVAIMEALLPKPPITSEQLRMLPNRNVAELGSVERSFGFTPHSLEGNIDYVKSVGFGDGMRILMGLGMPSRGARRG
jgi:NADH dehydrogenase